MRNFFAVLMFFAVISIVMTSCAGGNAGETAVTAAHGPADTALPHQVVLSIDENADERLILAAKNFCDRTMVLSQGGAVFTFVLSKNAIEDLRSGKADMILLANAAIPAFAPMTEAFRYKSYEHFSMTANSAETLSRLSDIVEANVFAGFYAGSDVFLSRGALDSKFKSSLKRGTEEEQETESVQITTISESTTRAFSLLGADVTEEKVLNARIAYLTQAGSAVEFSPSELDNPALLEAIRADTFGFQSGEEGSEASESLLDEPEQVVITRAFTGIKPVWLVFAPSTYEKLSQTNRAAVSESAAYMAADIDGVYLKYEQEKIDLLTTGDAVNSRDFAATRAQTLRLADEQAANMSTQEQKLRETISKIQ